MEVGVMEEPVVWMGSIHHLRRAKPPTGWKFTKPPCLLFGHKRTPVVSRPCPLLSGEWTYRLVQKISAWRRIW